MGPTGPDTSAKIDSSDVWWGVNFNHKSHVTRINNGYTGGVTI